MKRLRIPIFLACCLAAACLISMRIEGNPLPSFEKRKEMAFDLLPRVLYFHPSDETLELLHDHVYFDSDTMEWTSSAELETEVYPDFGWRGSMPQAYFTVDQVETHSPDLMLIVSMEGQILSNVLIRYEPETGQSRVIQGGYGSKWIRQVYAQMEVFNQIRTGNSPICIVNCHYKSYIYGNTIYGKNMLLDIDPKPEELEAPYFQHQDTGGIPLIEFEDFEPMVLDWTDSFQYMGRVHSPTEFLPEYPHSAVVHNRWIFGTAGVLLCSWLCFAGWQIVRARREAKAK